MGKPKILKVKDVKTINLKILNKVKKIKPDLIFFAVSSYEINILTAHSAFYVSIC